MREALRQERILILLHSMIESVQPARCSSIYRHAKRGPEKTAWVECRAGCRGGFVKSHGRVQLCTQCVGRGVELIDPYLEEWMGGESQDHVEFHSKLDLRRQLDRELGRLRHLQRVREGKESPLDPLIASLTRSQTWDRSGSYPDLRRALERLSVRFPTIAHVVVWSEVYGLQAQLSYSARGYRELGLQLLSKWMPDQIRIPKWLEPPREERLLKVEQMLDAGWNTRRIARTLKINQAKAKRLARTVRPMRTAA